MERDRRDGERDHPGRHDRARTEPVHPRADRRAQHHRDDGAHGEEQANLGAAATEIQDMKGQQRAETHPADVDDERDRVADEKCRREGRRRAEDRSHAQLF